MKTSPEMTQVNRAAEFLKKNFGKAPKVAIVLGSGLSSFTKSLKDKKIMPMEKIPGGAASTVKGHQGKLVLGKCGSTPVLALAGRIHGYEGHRPNQAVLNVRAAKKWGIKNFIITNAAGSTNRNYKPGSLVLLSDHINMTGSNPLIGKELYGGQRFPDMSDAYSKKWRAQVKTIANSLKIKIQEGVYCGLLGPTYETPTEIKLYGSLGAQLVGMSTVWEVIALHQMGANVIGISCVTNFGTGLTKNKLSHKEVIETTKKVEKKFISLIEGIIQKVR